MKIKDILAEITTSKAVENSAKQIEIQQQQGGGQAQSQTPGLAPGPLHHKNTKYPKKGQKMVRRRLGKDYEEIINFTSKVKGV